jgi:hypothetical protein
VVGDLSLLFLIQLGFIIDHQHLRREKQRAGEAVP